MREGDMRMRRFLVASVISAVTIMGLLAVPSSAGAATPSGSCPPGFEGPVAISSLDPSLQDFATFIDTQVGGNNDQKVCIAQLAAGSQGSRLNILDNRVAGF
jgi:hypothetical protein